MPTCAQCVRVFDCMTVCAAFVSGHTVVSVCVCVRACVSASALRTQTVCCFQLRTESFSLQTTEERKCQDTVLIFTWDRERGRGCQPMECDYCVIQYKGRNMGLCNQKMLQKLFSPSLKPFISPLLPTLSLQYVYCQLPLNFNKWWRIFLFQKLYFSSCHCFINQEEAF